MNHLKRRVESLEQQASAHTRRTLLVVNHPDGSMTHLGTGRPIRPEDIGPLDLVINCLPGDESL